MLRRLLTLAVLSLLVSRMGVPAAQAQLGQSAIDAAKRSVVKIETDSNGVGTGVVIRGSDGLYVLTNYHVVRGAQQIQVTPFARGVSDLAAELVPEFVDRGNDIALLRVSSLPDNTPSILLTAFATIEQNDEVTAIGHPGEKDWVVTQGSVSGIVGKDILIDVTLQRGSSGGPLLNERGQMVGLVSAREAPNSNFGFAIRSDVVQRIVGGWVKLIPDRILILVAEFDPQGTPARDRLDLTSTFAQHLDSAIYNAELQDKVNVRTLSQVLRAESEALEIGRQEAATVVIWGYYNNRGIRTNLKIIYLGSGSTAIKSISLGGDQGIEVSEVIQNPRGATADYLYEDVPREATTLAAAAIGLSYQMRNAYEDALTAYEIALTNSETRIRGFIYSNIGSIYSTHYGDYGRALESYLAAIDADPRDAEHYRNAGVVSNELGQHEKAIDYLENALILDPESHLVAFSLGSTYSSLGQWDTALQYYIRAVTLDPGYTVWWSTLAVVNQFLAGRRGDRNAEHLEQALEASRRAYALEPLSPPIGVTWGMALWGADRLAEADSVYSHVLDLIPEYDYGLRSWVYYWTGRNYYSMDRYGEALQMFQRALRYGHLSEDVDHIAQAEGRIGQTLIALGNPDSALVHLSTAAQLDPGDSQTFAILGRAHRRAGHFRDAIVALDSAVALDSMNFYAYRELGRAYFFTDRSSEAIGPLESARRIDPEDSQTLATLGFAYYLENRPLDAEEALRKSIEFELEPDNSLVHSVLSGIYHERLHQYDKAYHHARIADSLDPGNESFYSNFIETNFVTGRYAETVELAKAVATRPRTKPRDVIVMRFFTTAGCLFGGDTDAAREQLRQFVRAYRDAPAWDEIGWEFTGTKYYVIERSGVPAEVQTVVLAMIDLLQKPKSPDALDAFRAELPQELAAIVEGSN